MSQTADKVRMDCVYVCVYVCVGGDSVAMFCQNRYKRIVKKVMTSSRMLAEQTKQRPYTQEEANEQSKSLTIPTQLKCVATFPILSSRTADDL